MPTPLIPVKSLAEAKGRLAPEVNPIQRRLVTIAMLEDVLDACAATGGLAPPVVVSPDEEVWERVAALGCVVVREPLDGGGDDGERLNAALRRGAGSVTGDSLLVVAADVPLVDAEALGAVRDRLEEAPVVVVPSADGTGTNALGWRDPAAFAPAFGPGSAAQHLRAAGAVAVEDERLALDVDTYADLRAVGGRLDPARVTARRLADLRLLDRPESAAR